MDEQKNHIMPVGPLMKEHRLIERMIEIIENNLQTIKQSGNLDLKFIDTSCDFLKTYADKCHHGKEEDILFVRLGKKQLSDEHKHIIEELIKDHIYGRKTVSSLAEATEKYRNGDKTAFKNIVEYIKELILFYPKHIEKEDKRFFLPCMKYFNRQEQDDMLAEFFEFDRQLIHKRYRFIVEQFENKFTKPK